MVKVAHLLDLTVVVSYPGIQLLHEALMGIGLVIVNWSENQEEKRNDKCEERLNENANQGLNAIIVSILYIGL